MKRRQGLSKRGLALILAAGMLLGSASFVSAAEDEIFAGIEETEASSQSEAKEEQSLPESAQEAEETVPSADESETSANGTKPEDPVTDRTEQPDKSESETDASSETGTGEDAQSATQPGATEEGRKQETEDPAEAEAEEDLEEDEEEIELKTQAEKRTGWYSFQVSGKTITLYYDKNGKSVTGQRKIDGYWYMFDLTTGEMIKGWYNHTNITNPKGGPKTCYYDANGHMLYGQRKIGGYWYMFHPSSGAMTKGWYNHTNATNPKGGPKTCYYDANGHMLYGQRKIGGYWYMFHPSSGAMIKGWYNHTNATNPKGGPKTCYYDANGHMLYGQRKIGGYWYMFHPSSGAMIKGWYNHTNQTNPIGGPKTCYYDANGHMVYGTQKIDGVTYKFHTSSGALIQASGLSEANWQVLINVIGAVESGGQIYGRRDYAAYAGQFANSVGELTCTLGWAQYYGAEASKLIQRIYNADPAGFKKIDSKGEIQKKLGKDWVALKWDPSESEKATLIKLITTEVGKKQQDLLFREQCQSMVDDCIKTYSSDPKAIIMYCEIRHQGGLGSVKRIFDRCKNGVSGKVTKGSYTVSNIIAALDIDQEDGFNNQVGDYVTRHRKCAEFVEKYTVA